MSKAWKAKEAECGQLWQDWHGMGSVVRVPRSGADRRTIIGSNLLQTVDLMASDAYFIFTPEVKAVEHSTNYNVTVKNLIPLGGFDEPGKIWIEGVENSKGKIVPWTSAAGRQRVIRPGDKVIEGRKITKGKNKGRMEYTVQVQNKAGWEMTEVLLKGNHHFSMIGSTNEQGYFEQNVRATFEACKAKDYNRGIRMPKVPIVCMTRNRYPWWVVFPEYFLEAFGYSLTDFQVPVIHMPKMERSNCRALMCSLSGFHNTVSAKRIRRRYWVAVQRQDRLYSFLFRKLDGWVKAFDESSPF